MKILVIGKTGQLALSLAERAAGRHQVNLIGRPEFDLAQTDDFPNFLRHHRPDAVVNAAAYTAVDRAEQEPDAAALLNAAAPGSMARICAAANIPFVHISTDYVFAGDNGPYREGDPVAPVNAYGASKLAGEAAVQDAGGDSLIIRTSWVYSPFGKNFATTMLALATSRDQVSVVSDQIGNPTNALDIADGIIAALEMRQLKGRFPVGLAHLTGADEISWHGFAEAIFAASAALGGPDARVTPIPTTGYPTPAKRPADSRMDTALFRQIFDYRAPGFSASLHPTVARLLAS